LPPLVLLVLLLLLLRRRQAVEWKVTGIRYAWQDSPCCPGVQRGLMPCPVNNCPLQTKDSRLPAAPFSAAITDRGVCECTAPKTCNEIQ
jgi:hypothetical protein